MTLYRYRHQVQCLDTALSLTRGSPVGAWAMLEHLRFEHGSYTSVLRQDNNHPTMIGQMHYTNGERAARLSFIMPTRALETPGLNALIENLAREAGQRGAFNLLAEVDENSPVFEGLRLAGFGVYARQHVWKIDSASQNENQAACQWEQASDLDEFAIRGLYQMLTPPLVQSAELASHPLPQGLVFTQKGEIFANVAPIYGPRGIYLQPLIHPAIEDASGLLHSLVACMPFQLGRPVYIAVRSYQAWLENALHDLKGEASSRQVLLVKHLATLQRSTLQIARNGVLENRQPAMIQIPGEDNPHPLAQYGLESAPDSARPDK